MYIGVNKMLVQNLRSPRTGNSVANQFEIVDGNTAYLQSYSTLIAKKTGFEYTISSNWDYSRTTTKYFTEWLRDYGFNQLEIDTLKKWLRKNSTKNGSELVQLLNSNVKIKYVDEL